MSGTLPLRCRIFENWNRIGIFSACVVVIVGLASAQDTPSPPDSPTVERIVEQKVIEPEGDQLPNPKPEAEKRRKALAGLAALGGIVILGVGVIAATMLWARRLRRLARELGPPQKTAGNDFWFLKPPKSIALQQEIFESPRPPYPPPSEEPVE